MGEAELRMEEAKPNKLTLWQRLGLKTLRRKAGRGAGEPLEPEDWEVMWRLHEYGFNRAINWLFFALPRSPRCGVCGAPFEASAAGLSVHSGTGRRARTRRYARPVSSSRRRAV